MSITRGSAAGTSAARIRRRAGLLDPTPDQAGAFWRENEPHMLPADEERVSQAAERFGQLADALDPATAQVEGPNEVDSLIDPAAPSLPSPSAEL